MMTPKRVYFAMIGVNALLALAILGGIVFGDRMLSKQSDIIVAQKLESAVLEKEQISLQQARQDLTKYADLRQIAKQVVPQEKDQAATTRQIISLANQAGIRIGSIGFPSSNLGTAVPKATDSTSKDAAAPTTSAITQAKPVAGIPGLLALDIVVSSDNAKPSSYNQIIAFLASLENNRRTAEVSQITIQPDAKDNSLLNFNLTLTVYLKP